jgi:hypothetical protein
MNSFVADESNPNFRVVSAEVDADMSDFNGFVSEQIAKGWILVNIETISAAVGMERIAYLAMPPVKLDD